MLEADQLDVLTTADTARWRSVLEEIGSYDFFHLPEFHRLSEINGEGEAVLVVYREQGYAIALPMLLRDITLPSELGMPLGLRDATSIRGLAGPIASEGAIPGQVIRRFQGCMQRFFEANSVITAYSRLNPLLDQLRLLEGYGTVIEQGVTVSIDLTLPLDEQVRRYSRNRRQEVARLKKLGFSCAEAGIECLDDFMRVYYETMDRLEADKAYYFDRSFVEYLLTEMGDSMRLFVCRFDGNITSAVICADCPGMVEMYLAGMATESVPMSPCKLLYDSVREWATARGAKALHMGGSIGGKRDELYKFKMAFGCREHEYHTWRHVVDPEVYDDLCRELWLWTGAEPDVSYFPAYRNPSLLLQRASGPEQPGPSAAHAAAAKR